MVSYDNNNIYINNKKTKIVSGAMHYFRMVPQYWEDRLLKLKESGCNCVETYVCWNLHEKKEGTFDFSGGLDLGRFLDAANNLGLYAIVRPGPYMCSEWDFGGLPWWLLKYPDIDLRCNDERFLNLCTPYLEKVCEILKPRLITNGGNVIFVQIENEYGSYSDDKEYLEYLKNLYEKNGIDCGFITSDGEEECMLRGGTLPDVLASVNYRKESEYAIGKLREYRNYSQPGAVLELWNGRAMHWGEKFERRDVEEVKESVRSAIEFAELVNMYMFCGGTTFGFMNGTLDFGKELIVQMTSYDVDAPLDEYGRRTPKYYAEQEVICKALGKEIKNTAKDTVIFDYGEAKYVDACTLSDSGLTFGKFKSGSPKPMELYDQGYGYIAYETDVFTQDKGGKLMFPEIHDIAHIYIDGVYTKTLERYSTDKTVDVPSGEHHVAIIAENIGRVNYGTKMKDYKGIVGNILLWDNHMEMNFMITGYTVHTIPLEELPQKYSGEAVLNEPAFYKFTFIAEDVQDTVIHLKGFTRGVAFINGFNLGRHWDIENSDNKLFIPAPFIKQGENEIVVFDVLHKNDTKKITFGEFAK